MKRETLIKRLSVREYKSESLSVLKILEIEDIIKAQKPLFNIKYQIDVVSDGKSFQNIIGGIVGSYGKVYSPHYIVASTELKDECYENIGYLLENIVLKLTEMDIATCWIGGGIKKNLFKGYLKLDKELTPVAVIAFGNPMNSEIFRKDIKQFKRKSLEEIYTGELSDQNRDIMELVRIAPSSVNSQPWRYHFETNDKIQLFRVKNNLIMKQFIEEMNRIDLGISLCHFEIAAKIIGKLNIIENENIENKKLKYFVTIKLV
ncbi:MAG: hypothetical protein K0Q49_1210 [Haloplasmataceae bacterium]|jgi:nitroreductase|nr:hypothetical protein [Haloplasmataceae bacterium]